MRIRDIDELLRLRSAGLIEPSDGQPPHDWTEDESAVIKRAYKRGHRREDIWQWFPAEANEADDELVDES